MYHSNNENGGGGRNGNGDPAPQQNIGRDQIVKYYEGQLLKAKRGAWIVGALHSASRFLAFCNLTWATAVILGGFSSLLRPLDFVFVSVLLLIEAFRLATTVFFCRLATRSLHTLSQSPFIPNKEDRQAKTLWAVRVSSLLLQILFIAPSFVLPSLRFHSRPRRLSNVRNLNVALQIFYTFVLANGAVALQAVICSIVLLWHLYNRTEQSVHRYYDEVLQRSFDYGVEKADDFQFLDFAMEMLGQDFSRHLKPKDIQENNKNLIIYLHRNWNGPDAVLLALDSSDCFVQKAAVCLVGFWANEGLVKVPGDLPPALLTKLADKLGMLEIGWSAANSLSFLDAITALRIFNSARKPVIDVLINLIQTSTQKCSLVFLRVLTKWLQPEATSTTPPPIQLEQARTKLLQKLKGNKGLVGDLRTLLESSQLQRTRVLAGYLLMLIKPGNFQPIQQINPQSDSYLLVQHIRLINPQSDFYFLRSEVRMYNDLCRCVGLEEYNWDQASTTSRFVIRDD